MKLVEAVVVSYVVDMAAKVVEVVVMAHPFEIEMVPILVGFSLDQLKMYQKQL